MAVAAAALLVLPLHPAVALALAALAVRVTWTVVSRRRVRPRGRGPAPGPDAILLGSERSGRPVSLGDHELSAHGLIVGASGAGKSTTMLTILTEQIRRDRPVVAIDLKGSPAFARELELAASSAGRELRVWTPDGPSHWNPLADGNATELKDKLIATERFSEPHYQRAAERYLQLALQVLLLARPGRAPALADVVDVLEPKRLQALARRLPHDRREHIRGYLAGLTPDQTSAIRGLASRLAIISESHTGEFLAPGGTGGTIDLRAALTGGDVVLFSLNSSTYGRLAGQLGTLAVQDLVTAVGQRLSAGPDASRPAIVAIDEFSALGSDNVMALLARGREAGVSVLLATQELADLDRAGRGLRDQILGNTAVKIAHRQEVPASAETIAQMSGKAQRWERTVHVGPGRWGGTDTSRGTLRLVDGYVIEPDEISGLSPGDAVLITKLPSRSARTIRVAPPRRDGPER
jgi:conjugal transfer pilus assembly protein TraD